MRSMKTVAALLCLSLIGIGCGRLRGDEVGGGTGRIDHPTGPDDLVLRIELIGGFVPIEYDLVRLPGLSIYGDGRMIVEGPTIEIYPGPALPNLLVSRLTEEALQAVLAEAEAAGLLGADASYEQMCVADAPTTRFTVDAGGARHVVSAYALEVAGASGPTAACGDEDVEARGRLSRFQARIGDLRSWLPEGSVGPEESYVPSELRFFVSRYRGEPDLPQATVPWPLPDPLGQDAAAEPGAEPYRCDSVAGDDAASLLEAAVSANQLTPWESGGREYRVLFRPLLPDEHGC